jgi:hypothetical protein
MNRLVAWLRFIDGYHGFSALPFDWEERTCAKNVPFPAVVTAFWSEDE